MGLKLPTKTWSSLFAVLVTAAVAASASPVATGQEPTPEFDSPFTRGMPSGAGSRPPKVDSKISPVIRGVLSELQARRVTRTNAQSMDISSLSVEGLLSIDDNGNIQTYVLVNETGQRPDCAA